MAKKKGRKREKKTMGMRKSEVFLVESGEVDARSREADDNNTTEKSLNNPIIFFTPRAHLLRPRALQISQIFHYQLSVGATDRVWVVRSSPDLGAMWRNGMKRRSAIFLEPERHLLSDCLLSSVGRA